MTKHKRFETIQKEFWQVRCTTFLHCNPGCDGTGPRGDTPSEAIELAIELGWKRNNDGDWVCPKHQEKQE